jgi:hypothetical protein
MPSSIAAMIRGSSNGLGILFVAPTIIGFSEILMCRIGVISCLETGGTPGQTQAYQRHRQ